MIREHGHGALFPKTKLDQDQRRNTYASNEVADWLNNLIPDERKSFHSWRATVRSPVTKSGLPVEEQIRKKWDAKKKGGLPTSLRRRAQ